MTRWAESPGGLLVPADEGVDGEVVAPGICSVCGCTEHMPCIIEGPDPSGVDDTHCAWTDDSRTLCTGCA